MAIDVISCFPLNCVMIAADPSNNYYNLGHLLW